MKLIGAKLKDGSLNLVKDKSSLDVRQLVRREIQKQVARTIKNQCQTPITECQDIKELRAARMSAEKWREARMGREGRARARVRSNGIR